MELNGKLVSTIVKKITPFMKKESKVVEHPNKIYFKPSDVPLEEFGDEVAENVKVLDDAVVAPFADRLIHPNLFGLTPAVNDIKHLVDNTRQVIDSVKDDKIKETFSKLYPKILDNMKDVPKASHRMTSLIRSIELVENPKIKESILKQIDFLCEREPKSFKNFFENSMSFAEDYADAVNTINGKYLCIDNSAHKLYKWMDKRNIWLADIIDGTKKSEDTYRNRLLSSKTRNKKYPEYLECFDKYSKKGYAQTHQNNLRQDAMKKFFNIYVNTRPDEVRTLYYEEYLKTLPEDLAKECAEIQQKYNTYVINSNKDTTLEDLKFIKEELRLWKEAGKDEAKTPDLIFINIQDDYLLKNHSTGCASRLYNTVVVRELLNMEEGEGQCGSVLRHEIQHLHDEETARPKNTFEELKDAIVWRYQKIKNGKKWDKELENAGIKDPEHRAYALTEQAELMSVSAEADGEQLTDEYITDMCDKFKMKHWIFKINENLILKNRRLLKSLQNPNEHTVKN